MPNFRRYWRPGGTFFFTVVTARRAPLFHDELARSLLGKAFREECAVRPFSSVAIVLLPDHLHTVWTMPPGDFDFSLRWSSIKSSFTREWLASGGSEQTVPDGQRRQERRGVWQARFYEHRIRDEDDLIQHVNYIHFNPVKHQLAKCPSEWPWSSFQRFVQHGDYPIDWACSERGDRPQFSRVDSKRME
jgi:putative transposase